MEGGRDWWQQILEALDHVEYLVLIMTPAAMASQIVAKEWRMARQKGVGVVPVIGAKGLSFASLPPWMRQAHFVDTEIPEQWLRFVRTLEGPVEKVRVPFMVEDLPLDFIHRPREYEIIVKHLLAPHVEHPVATTVVLRGAGGYGKTTLARAICHDENVQENFPDGVLWVTLGKQPGKLISFVEDLIVMLTGQRPGFSAIEAASARLAELLQDRAMLIVIDDVWEITHSRWFLQGGPRCTRLITTRNSGSVPEKAIQLSVDAMRSDEALALLRYGLPPGQEKALYDLTARLGEWPVLLKLVNGLLRDRIVEKHEPFPAALAYVRRALDKKRLTAFDANEAVRKTIDVSLGLFNEEEQQRYAELAIFPEDVEIPIEIVQKLWEATAEFDEFDTQELCRRLHNLSLLLDVNLATQRIRLHDVFTTYIFQAQTEDKIKKIHGIFLDSYGLENWSDLDCQEPYLWKWLSYHLDKAGRHEELITLLWRFDWLQKKLGTTDVVRLLEDFERASAKGTLKLLMQAVELSSDTVQANPRQLAGQLIGRLSHLEAPEVRSLLDDVINSQRTISWFRPLLPSLVAPGGALLRTLRGHTDVVTALAMTPNSGQLVSGSYDKSLKVWNLLTGQSLRTLTGHEDVIWAIAVTPDGQQIISGSEDKTLKVWDLATGRVVRTLCGHEAAVLAVAVTPDGQQIISGSEDQTIKVWDLTTGQTVRTMSGHEDAVWAVVVLSDNRQVISASEDGSLKVWDFISGKAIRTLLGHSHAVWAVAVTPDEEKVVSGSYGQTIKVWDLETGKVISTLRGHEDAIWAVEVVADGQQVVSAAADQTLKIWSLTTGQEVRTLGEHGAPVRAVTLSGERVISGSEDKTIKVWSLVTGQGSPYTAWA